MLDPQLFRTDPDAVAVALAARGYVFDVDAFRRLENERKAIQVRTQELQSRRNTASKQIGMAKSRGEDTTAMMVDVSSAGDELKACESQLDIVQQQLREMMLEMPNLGHPSVPVGRAESDNVEVRRWGTSRTFDFTPKDHADLGEALGMIDFATLSFTKTRARTNDPATSHAAAKHAATGRAAYSRSVIVAILRSMGPLTARELALHACIEYHTIQRRISECAGIERTGEVRDGCAVWRAVDKPTGEFHFLDEADKHRLQLERKSVK